MPLPAHTYDLTMILDPQAEEDVRAKIVADTSAAIEAQGELLRHDAWGDRALAYPIEHRSSGEYHLLQFRPGSTELLDGLHHTLRITDGLLRFRIIKLRPGVPEAPDMGAVVAAAPPAEGSVAGGSGEHPASEPREQPASEPGEQPASEPGEQPGAAEVAVGEPA